MHEQKKKNKNSKTQEKKEAIKHQQEMETLEFELVSLLTKRVTQLRTDKGVVEARMRSVTRNYSFKDHHNSITRDLEVMSPNKEGTNHTSSLFSGNASNEQFVDPVLSLSNYWTEREKKKKTKQSKTRKNDNNNTLLEPITLKQKKKDKRLKTEDNALLLEPRTLKPKKKDKHKQTENNDFSLEPTLFSKKKKSKPIKTETSKSNNTESPPE